jgi:hypothetical protein
MAIKLGHIVSLRLAYTGVRLDWTDCSDNLARAMIKRLLSVVKPGKGARDLKSGLTAQSFHGQIFSGPEQFMKVVRCRKTEIVVPGTITSHILSTAFLNSH